MAENTDAGKLNHIIEGVGNPRTAAGRCAVAHYLSGFEGRVPDYTDIRSGAGIIIDRSKSSPVVIVQKKWDIHAFHVDPGHISRKLDRGVWH